MRVMSLDSEMYTDVKDYYLSELGFDIKDLMSNLKSLTSEERSSIDDIFRYNDEFLKDDIGIRFLNLLVLNRLYGFNDVTVERFVNKSLGSGKMIGNHIERIEDVINMNILDITREARFSSVLEIMYNKEYMNRCYTKILIMKGYKEYRKKNKKVSNALLGVYRNYMSKDISMIEALDSVSSILINSFSDEDTSEMLKEIIKIKNSI